MEEYLPLGSVVLVENSEQPLMIYGRKMIHRDSGEGFDYVTCLYPAGYIDDDYTIFVQHNQITEVLYMGYQTEKDRAFTSEYLGKPNSGSFL